MRVSVSASVCGSGGEAGGRIGRGGRGTEGRRRGEGEAEGGRAGGGGGAYLCNELAPLAVRSHDGARQSLHLGQPRPPRLEPGANTHTWCICVRVCKHLSACVSFTRTQQPRIISSEARRANGVSSSGDSHGVPAWGRAAPPLGSDIADAAFRRMFYFAEQIADFVLGYLEHAEAELRITCTIHANASFMFPPACPDTIEPDDRWTNPLVEATVEWAWQSFECE